MRIIYAFFFRVATLTDYADTYGAHGFLKLYMDQKKATHIILLRCHG